VRSFALVRLHSTKNISQHPHRLRKLWAFVNIAHSALFAHGRVRDFGP
jgi:hypothetical protein